MSAVPVYRSWGGMLWRPQAAYRPRFRDDLAACIRDARLHQFSLLGVGLGRSYGDSGLGSKGAAIESAGLDRFMAFDTQTGCLRAEAGTSLDSILAFSVPQGWFLPVVPGTKFVTLAGAVANDIHGKNHATAAAFGNHVSSIGLLRTDGSNLTLRPGDALFHATIGGLGLTGIIAWVELNLERIASAKMRATHIPFGSIWEYLDLALEGPRDEYAAAWVDCQSRGKKLGRGIFSMAHFEKSGSLEPHIARPILNVPVLAPNYLLNRMTLAAFNKLYARRITQRIERVEHYDTHLFPLDRIENWNRLYGRRGFYQYQCVIPREYCRAAVPQILQSLAASGLGSSLAVIKTFGDKPSRGLLSYPAPGVNIALDLTNRGDLTLEVMTRLDSIVRDAGGRLYPAKDGRISASMFQHSYPDWRAFNDHRDPGMSSAFWERVSTAT